MATGKLSKPIHYADYPLAVKVSDGLISVTPTLPDNAVIIDAEFLYNDDLYYLVRTDKVIPGLSIGKTGNAKAVSCLLSTAAPNVRNLQIRIVYITA